MRYALLPLLFACNDDFQTPATPEGGSAERVDAILALTGDATAGEAVFDDKCAVCHDPTGQADVVGPALDPWISVEGATEAETLTVVIDGQGAMPGQTVTDQEAADLVAWMYETWGGGGTSGPDGAALYDANCAACHSTDGTYKVGPSMTTAAAGRDASYLEVVIRDGVPSTSMPAFGSSLSADEITAIATWLAETF